LTQKHVNIIDDLQRKISELENALEKIRAENIQDRIKLEKANNEKEKIEHKNGDLELLSIDDLIKEEKLHFEYLQRIAILKATRLIKQEEESHRLKVEKIILEERELRATKALDAELKQNKELVNKISVVQQLLDTKAEEFIKLTLECKETAQIKNKNMQLIGENLKGLSMKELEELEDLHHKGIKKVGVAKQEQLQTELLKLQREKEQLQDQAKCVVCIDTPISVVLIPCGHRNLCKSCAASLKTCPLCRTAITNRIDTY